MTLSTPPPGVPERRAASRRLTHVRAQVTTAEADERLDAHTIDLSEEGVSLICHQQLNVGLECVVEIGTGRPELTPPLTVRAVVRYCIAIASDRSRIGLRFIGLSPDDTQTIEAMLR